MKYALKTVRVKSTGYITVFPPVEVSDQTPSGTTVDGNRRLATELRVFDTKAEALKAYEEETLALPWST